MVLTRDVAAEQGYEARDGNIDGLTPNTEYVFQVAAVNFNGSKAISVNASYLLSY